MKLVLGNSFSQTENEEEFHDKERGRIVPKKNKSQLLRESKVGK